MSRGPVKVVIVTALQLEFAAVCEHLSESTRECHPQGNIYHRGKFHSGDAVYDVLVVEAGQGNNAAAVETERAIAHFRPALALFVGISGGIKDVKIGDVIAADEVFNYESAKAKDALEPRPHSFTCTYRLIQVSREVSRRRQWITRAKSTSQVEPPSSMIGPILAGEKVVASQSSATFAMIRANYGHCLAVEMEAFGFLSAISRWSGVESLVIRGVSDLIEDKSKADAGGSQPRAARNASAFAFEVLSVFEDTTSNAPLAAPSAAESSLSVAISAKASLDTLRERFVIQSQTLLLWQMTVQGGHRIKTPAEHVLLDRILQSGSSTSLIIGAKGVGKSALCAAIGGSAVRKGLAVLAIRADRLPASLASQDELSKKHLQLPLQLNEAITLLSMEQKVVLIIDQLDSVSELTDRQSNRLNLLLNLINELSGQPNVHIIAGTREFDYRHDARLSTIHAEEVTLDPPPWEEVAAVLITQGHDAERLSSTARELLRIPWHLDLFLRVAPSGKTPDSLQALIGQLWQQSVTNSTGPSGRIELLERMALRMSNEEELYLPIAIADDAPQARDALLHDEILVADKSGLTLAFRHQTFYDHALARLFSRSEKSLAEFVLKGQDGLFVRPVMLSGLELLRSTAPGIYKEEIQKILHGTPRLHILTLLLEFLAQQRNPNDFEVQIIVPFLKGEHAPLILRAAAGIAPALHMVCSVKVETRHDRHLVTLSFGKLQAGEQGFLSDALYFACGKSKSLILDAVIRADEFEAPLQKQLQIDANGRLRSVAWSEYKAMLSAFMKSAG